MVWRPGTGRNIGHEPDVLVAGISDATSTLYVTINFEPIMGFKNKRQCLMSLKHLRCCPKIRSLSQTFFLEWERMRKDKTKTLQCEDEVDLQWSFCISGSQMVWPLLAAE